MPSEQSARSSLSFEEMEAVYAALAEVVDQVGERSTPMFLTKLALLLSRELGDVDAVKAAISSAALDLQGDAYEKSRLQDDWNVRVKRLIVKLRKRLLEMTPVGRLA